MLAIIVIGATIVNKEQPMAVQRPKMSTYRAARAEQARREQSGPEEELELARQDEIRMERIRQLIVHVLPILKTHVEPSPVEVWRKTTSGLIFKSSQRILDRVVGGWPIAYIGPVSDTGSDDNRTGYSVLVTDEARLGLCSSRARFLHNTDAYLVTEAALSNGLEVADIAKLDSPRNDTYQQMNPINFEIWIGRLLADEGVSYTPPPVLE